MTRTVSGEQVLLPIWHGVTKQQVMDYSPPLADKLARSTATHTVTEIAAEIAVVVEQHIVVGSRGAVTSTAADGPRQGEEVAGEREGWPRVGRRRWDLPDARDRGAGRPPAGREDLPAHRLGAQAGPRREAEPRSGLLARSRFLASIGTVGGRDVDADGATDSTVRGRRRLLSSALSSGATSMVTHLRFCVLDIETQRIGNDAGGHEDHPRHPAQGQAGRHTPADRFRRAPPSIKGSHVRQAACLCF